MKNATANKNDGNQNGSPGASFTENATMKKIIKLKCQGQARYVVDAPPTGFRSTENKDKATQFDSANQAEYFCRERGIFTGVVVNYYKTPKLTAFEKFCWDNGDRSSATLATETNRTEQAVCAAYTRAHNKARELAAQEAVYS